MNAAPADIDLPDIPNHWTVRPIKYVGRLVTGGTPPTSDSTHYSDREAEGFPWFRPEDLDDSGRPSIASRFLTKSGLATVPRLPPKSVQVVSIGATLGKIGYVDTEAASNQQINAVVGAACPKFVFYCLTASRDRIWASSMGNTIPIISAGRLGAVKIPVPPVDEQNAIADFLDAETAKVDALIAKQEQLIATLREDRTATITHAVTKGLNPDVEMKETGVPWIGRVPFHWTVGKIKHGFSVTLGKMYQGAAQHAADVELPHLKAGSLTPAGLQTENPMMCWFTPGEIRSLSLKKGDVLVVEGGAIGRCVVLDRDLEGWGFQKSLNRVRARGDDSPEFLAYLIETATESGHVAVLCGKSTIGHFTAEKVEALEWPHPTVQEQRAIVAFLTARCAEIDLLIAKAKAVIETLREYRSALITDAVTGKIDVRGAA